MNLDELKDNGFKIVTTTQEINKKSIFLFNSDDVKKFSKYNMIAKKQKCKFIICNDKFKKNLNQNTIKYFYYKNQKDLEKIAKIFYDFNDLEIIFVTGTNGKTSIAYGANILFNINGKKSCYIGTLGFYINSKKIKNLNNTTPSYFEILNLINIAREKKIKYVFMEVSSIGYCEGRVGNIRYNFCVLTNLKSDHLDYHISKKKYHLAKINLIKKQKLENSILFLQDYKLKNKFKSFEKKLIVQRNFKIKNKISIVQRGLDTFEIISNDKSYKIKSFNDFMVNNIITILMVYRKIFKNNPLKLNNLLFPPGRSEIIHNKNNKVIIIDYAHSKDAYENLLYKFAKLEKYIIIIYGCGGNRDKIKRPQIAKVVSKFTNLQIITDDNPRFEDPEKIRKTLIKYSSNPIEIPNRRKAIKVGVSILKKLNGILIIAGKGHEEMQIYKDKYYSFNDRAISSNYAKNL